MKFIVNYTFDKIVRFIQQDALLGYSGSLDVVTLLPHHFIFIVSIISS